jgi:peptidoglycan hydrolase-like protein with peptidoglycan-binding domain
LAAFAVVAALAWWAGGLALARDEPTSATSAAPTTVEVAEQTIGRESAVTVTVTQPYSQIATNVMSGVVTAVSEGVIAVGDPLYEVSSIAVRALPGDVPFYRDLELGLQGEDVKQLQHGLNELGFYDASIDGKFGTETRAAVREWQEDIGVERTGTVSWSSVVAVPSLPQHVRIADEIFVAGVVSGGEPSVLAQVGERQWQLRVSDSLASQITPASAVSIDYQGYTWEATTGNVTVDENQQSVVTVVGTDGVEPCGSDCAELPADELFQVAASVTLVPDATGPAVPAAAISTDATGAAHVTMADGTDVAVTVVAAQDGIVLVDGLDVGDTVIAFASR